MWLALRNAKSSSRSSSRLTMKRKKLQRNLQRRCQRMCPHPQMVVYCQTRSPHAEVLQINPRPPPKAPIKSFPLRGTRHDANICKVPTGQAKNKCTVVISKGSLVEIGEAEDQTTIAKRLMTLSQSPSPRFSSCRKSSSRNLLLCCSA